MKVDRGTTLKKSIWLQKSSFQQHTHSARETSAQLLNHATAQGRQGQPRLRGPEEGPEFHETEIKAMRLFQVAGFERIARSDLVDINYCTPPPIDGIRCTPQRPRE